MILESNLATGKSSVPRIWGRKTICWATETKGLKSFELEEHLFPKGEQRLAFLEHRVHCLLPQPEPSLAFVTDIEPNEFYLWFCAQSCLTLWGPMDCSPPGFLPWNCPGKNRGVGCHFLLQEIFPIQDPCLFMLLHWQADSLPVCHPGSPKSLKVRAKMLSWRK